MWVGRTRYILRVFRWSYSRAYTDQPQTYMCVFWTTRTWNARARACGGDRQPVSRDQLTEHHDRVIPDLAATKSHVAGG